MKKFIQTVNSFLQGSLLIGPVIIMGLSNSYAQTDKDLDSLSLKDLLNVKVSTISKTSQALDMAPATALVITQDQIRSRGYQSLLDVMYDLPDVKVDDKIYSMIRNTFTVRGIQGQEKFVILMDGIRVSSPSGEAMPIMENYPVNLVEQIEVVYGPASALYGAYAVAGVINIITKKSPGKKGISVDVSSVAGTNGYTNTTLYLAKKISEDVSIVVSGQYSYDKGADLSKLYPEDSALSIASYSTGTLNSIYGPMTPAKPITPEYEAPMNAFNVYAALRVHDFTFSYFKNAFTVPTAFGSNTSNAVYNKEAYMRQSIDVADATLLKSFGKFTSTTSLTASQYNIDPGSNYRNLYTGMEPAYKYSTASMVKGEEQLDYNPSDKIHLTGGASYESYYVIPHSTDLQDPVNLKGTVHGTYLGTQSYYNPNGLAAQFYVLKFNNIGTYLQAQYSPRTNLNITVGGRYDINSRYGDKLNPRMGITWKPFEKTTIKAMYGSAFLAPSGSDAYAQYGSFDTQDSGKTYHSFFLHLPNPGLKPITSQTVELSIRQYITDNISVTVDGYYTLLKGLHEFADDNETTKLYNNSFNGIPVDYVEVFVNQAREKIYGGSLQFNYKWAAGRIRATSYASFSYVTGYVDHALTEEDETTEDDRLEFISPMMFRVGTDLKVGKFTTSPRLIIIGKQNIGGISDTTTTIWTRQTLPGYALLNLSVRYNVVKRFSIFMNVSNALNIKYRSVSFNMDLDKKTDTMDGQPQDRIRVMGGINYNF